MRTFALVALGALLATGTACRPSNLNVGAYHFTGEATGIFRYWTHREPVGALATTCGGYLRNNAEPDQALWQVQVGCSGRVKQPFNEDPSIFLPFRGFNQRVVTRASGLVSIRDELGAVGGFAGVADWEIGSEVRSLDGSQGQYRPLIIHRLEVPATEICDVFVQEDCETMQGGTLVDHRVWIADDQLTVDAIP